MKSNPYEPPTTKPPTTVHTEKKGRRLLIAGITCIAFAFICVLVTIVGMMRAFNVLAREEAISPSDLADSIAIAIIPSYLGGPLGIMGVVLVIIGWFSRR